MLFRSIYNFLKEEFIKNIDINSKLYVVQNLRPWFYDLNNITEKNKFYLDEVIPFFSKTWGEKYLNPKKDAEKYMIDLGQFKFPYLNWTCDYHYSHLGADFFSEYLSVSYKVLVLIQNCGTEIPLPIIRNLLSSFV